jgi:hypothetical protein
VDSVRLQKPRDGSSCRVLDGKMLLVRRAKPDVLNTCAASAIEGERTPPDLWEGFALSCERNKHLALGAKVIVGRGIERMIEPCSGNGRRVANDGAARTRSGRLFYEFGLDEIPTDNLFTTYVLATAVPIILHY